MKQFIDKLISRLEEEGKKWLDAFEKESRKGNYDKYSDGMNDAFDEAVEIVNQSVEKCEIGELSDGYHTFNELYHHRAVLFATICNSNKELAWKSKLHDTGEMYEGMFIVGIETPQGQATYHYDIEPYWDMFKVKELPKAPKWDGHTPDEAIKRIGVLAEEYKGGWISVKDRLPEYENKDGSWVRCIVKVMRSHYPTSTYDDCDSPYDETIVMCAMYDVEQKIWHLDCDEQLNALIDIDDSPMNGDYVIEWMSLKSL